MWEHSDLVICASGCPTESIQRVLTTATDKIVMANIVVVRVYYNEGTKERRSAHRRTFSYVHEGNRWGNERHEKVEINSPQFDCDVCPV